MLRKVRQSADVHMTSDIFTISCGHCRWQNAVCIPPPSLIKTRVNNIQFLRTAQAESKNTIMAMALRTIGGFVHLVATMPAISSLSVAAVTGAAITPTALMASPSASHYNLKS